MKKLLNVARVLVPAVILASLIGCSSALESDVLSASSLAALSASAQNVETPPPSLIATDWAGYTEPGAGDPVYASLVVLHFEDSSTVTVIKTDLSRTIYAYDYINGGGEVIIDPDTSSYFNIDSAGNIMNLDDELFGVAVTLHLLPKLTLDQLTGTVWDTITPRQIYSSIDFEPGTYPIIGNVQATFGDGTFPLYNLDYYDNVSAGIIESLGMFYLDYREDCDGNDVIAVIFPNFYGYHMTQEVVYLPSRVVLKTLEETKWEAADGTTVTFSSGEATFSDDSEPHPYVYNGFEAGGVGKPTDSPSPEGGSFEITHTDTEPLKLNFYDFRASGANKVFTPLQP